MSDSSSKKSSSDLSSKKSLSESSSKKKKRNKNKKGRKHRKNDSSDPSSSDDSDLSNDSDYRRKRCKKKSYQKKYPIKLCARLILSDPLSVGSSFYVACICNHCHWKSLNCCSKMGLTSHLSCVYDTFSYYCVSFSLMTNLTMISSMTSITMMVLGPDYLVRALFHFLKILLVVSVDFFSFSRVIGIFSFSQVNGIFSSCWVKYCWFKSCQIKYLRVKSCRVNWIFSCSKTFIVSNSEFLI